MAVNSRYIRFDWAVKRMLRDKANFAVLEGLITVLTGEKVTIVEILESEGNMVNTPDKLSRVDVKVKNGHGDIIIVEVRVIRELHYRQRIVCGMPKAITGYGDIGYKYDEVKKVYFIIIPYFDLGKGCDYLYHGKTEFKGVHTGDLLRVNMREANEIKMAVPEDVFPEYYIIRVNEFNDVASTPIEEWLDYLKNNRIKDDTSTPGLKEARQRLLYMTMTDSDRRAYDAYMDDIMVQNDVLDTAKMEGRAEGILSTAKNLKAMGMADADIQRATGLSLEEIADL